MSNHLLLNDKSQSLGTGIVCGLFSMRKYPCHWHKGYMGHVCGQWERSLGAIISRLLFPSLISNKNRTKRTWLREKKKCTQGNKQGLLFSMDGRWEETPETKQRLSVVLGFACFPCVRDAHEATRKQICADPNVSIGGQVT